MEYKTIYTNLSIIRKLFFVEKIQIIIVGVDKDFQDEKNKIFTSTLKGEALIQFCNNISTKFILACFSNIPTDDFLENTNLEGVIDFSNKNKSNNNNKTFTSFYFFNNPDKSMRWIFPTKSKSPSFLNLYNGSGVKASAFKIAAKLLHRIGWIRPIVSGQFSIFSKNKNAIQRHLGELSYDDFSIFTGTVGENRKVIIALSSDERCTHFVKIPLTSAAEQLVNNEFEQLENIASLDLRKLDFPKVKKTKTGVAVSNVQPQKIQKDNSFQAIHLQVLQKLYEQSVHQKEIVSLSMWSAIEDGILFFPKIKKLDNGLSLEKVRQLQNVCESIFYQIDPNENMKVGIGHGDFTPWNMYVGKEKLHLYDWEMCTTDTPLLFDVFHYFFQKGILIERKGIENIEEDIHQIFELPEGKMMLKAFKLDWKKYYQFYLLYIVCYYLPKYATQNHLHIQVHWLVDTWIGALEKMEVQVSYT